MLSIPHRFFLLLTYLSIYVIFFSLSLNISFPSRPRIISSSSARIPSFSIFSFFIVTKSFKKLFYSSVEINYQRLDKPKFKLKANPYVAKDHFSFDSIKNYRKLLSESMVVPLTQGYRRNCYNRITRDSAASPEQIAAKRWRVRDPATGGVTARRISRAAS